VVTFRARLRLRNGWRAVGVIRVERACVQGTDQQVLTNEWRAVGLMHVVRACVQGTDQRVLTVKEAGRREAAAVLERK